MTFIYKETRLFLQSIIRGKHARFRKTFCRQLGLNILWCLVIIKTRFSYSICDADCLLISDRLHGERCARDEGCELANPTMATAWFININYVTSRSLNKPKRLAERQTFVKSAGQLANEGIVLVSWILMTPRDVRPTVWLKSSSLWFSWPIIEF